MERIGGWEDVEFGREKEAIINLNPYSQYYIL